MPAFKRKSFVKAAPHPLLQIHHVRKVLSYLPLLETFEKTAVSKVWNQATGEQAKGEEHTRKADLCLFSSDRELVVKSVTLKHSYPDEDDLFSYDLPEFDDLHGYQGSMIVVFPHPDDPNCPGRIKRVRDIPMARRLLIQKCIAHFTVTGDPHNTGEVPCFFNHPQSFIKLKTISCSGHFFQEQHITNFIQHHITNDAAFIMDKLFEIHETHLFETFDFTNTSNLCIRAQEGQSIDLVHFPNLAKLMLEDPSVYPNFSETSVRKLYLIYNDNQSVEDLLSTNSADFGGVEVLSIELHGHPFQYHDDVFVELAEKLSQFPDIRQIICCAICSIKPYYGLMCSVFENAIPHVEVKKESLD